VDDVEALQARAGEILRDPALRARMSARAAAFVRERFGMERMVRETLDVCGIPHASLGGAP
jgi:glycosyltransferase involved in cell wall biosynthesis